MWCSTYGLINTSELNPKEEPEKLNNCIALIQYFLEHKDAMEYKTIVCDIKL